MVSIQLSDSAGCFGYTSCLVVLFSASLSHHAVQFYSTCHKKSFKLRLMAASDNLMTLQALCICFLVFFPVTSSLNICVEHFLLIFDRSFFPPPEFCAALIKKLNKAAFDSTASSLVALLFACWLAGVTQWSHQIRLNLLVLFHLCLSCCDKSKNKH